LRSDAVSALGRLPQRRLRELVEIATCIFTVSPKSETRWREVDEQSSIERGGQSVVDARSPVGGCEKARISGC
jgi:hypothetical protein